MRKTLGRPCRAYKTYIRSAHAEDAQEAMRSLHDYLLLKKRKLRTTLNCQAQHSLMSIKQEQDMSMSAVPPSRRKDSPGGVFDSASSSGGALVVPDVLLLGQPAVLQSSAIAECAQSAPGRPAAAGAPRAGASLAEAPVPTPKRSKHEAVLMLQHLHELEEVMQERGGV